MQSAWRRLNNPEIPDTPEIPESRKALRANFKPREGTAICRRLTVFVCLSY